MSLIAAVIVVLGTANNSLFAQLPTITEKISAPLVYTSHIFERTLSDAGSTISQYSAAALTGAKTISENGRAILSLASGSQNSQEIFVDFEDESLPVVSTQDSQVAELRSTPQTPNQPTFPPQVTTLEGSRIYVPETTYTTINSDAIEKKLLIQKDYFSKQIDRIYDRLQTTSGDLNDRIDVVGTGSSSGISFATIALGGTGISTVPSYGQLLMGDGSGGYTLIATSSLGISSGVSSQWTTAGSDIYYIGGNVGIGTTTLNGRLTIEQTHDAQTVARIANYSDSANAYTELSVRAGNVTTYLGSTPQNSSAVTGAGSSGRGYVWSQATGANRGLDLIAASTNSDLRFYTAGTAAANERMRITSTGDVGIGTTSPNAKLSIYSGAAGIYSVNAAADELVLENSGSGGMSIVTPDASTGNIFFGSPSRQIGSQLSWNYNNLLMTIGTGMAGGQVQILAGNAAEAMRINSSGNVGIGTTTPNAALNVNTTLTNGTPAFRISNTSAGPTWNGLVIDSNNASSIDARNWFIGANSVVYGDFNIRTSNVHGGNPTTSGTSRFYISETGNVGIGTTSPARKLHVESANADAARLRITETADSSSGHSAGIELFDTTTFKGGIFKNGLTHSIGLWDASSERLTVVQGGSIGIGTTTPDAKLHVAMSTGLIPAIAVDTGSIVSNTTSSGSSAALSIIAGAAGFSTLNFGDTGDENIGYIQYGHTNNYLALGANTNEYIRITSAGNVGIGTSTPGLAKLIVEGTNGTALSGLGISNTANSANSRTYLNFYDVTAENSASIGSVREGSATDWGLIFRTGSGNSSSGPSDRMYISAAGNVGIGTASPSDAFTVSGTRPVSISPSNIGGVGYGVNIKGDTGGWVTGYTFTGSSNTALGGFGANGTANTLSKFFVGTFNTGEIMTMLASGKVGVGTLTPNFALEVNGQASTTILSVPSSPANSTPTRWIGTSNQQSLSFDATSGTSLTSQGSMLFSIDSNINDTTRKFIFQTNQDRYSSSDTGAGTSLMVIQENGSVGIGTTSPTYMLEVAGNVGATSFINMSSRSVKKDISYIPFEQTQQTLDKIKALKFATYRYITENDSEPLHLGLIAEESPEDILAPGGRGIDVYKMATFALQGIQSLIARIEKIEATLANVATGYTDIFKAKTVEVEQGITIKDSKTGEYYCIVVENGTMKNIPGKCGTVPVDSSNNENSSDSDDSADSDLSDSDDSEADAGDDEESGDTSTADDVTTEDSESESDTDETNEQSEEGATESAEENTDEGTEGSSSEPTTATNESSQNNESAEDAESTESPESSSDQSSDSAPAASSSDTGDSSEGSSDSSSSSSSESSSSSSESSSESSSGSTDSGSSGTQE